MVAGPVIRCRWLRAGLGVRWRWPIWRGRTGCGTNSAYAGTTALIISCWSRCSCVGDFNDARDGDHHSCITPAAQLGNINSA